jgi:diacylglycerol O-acyltransferase / wax synthase
LIAGVPVNLREEGQEGGNAAGFLWALLGTDLTDPVERLEVVKKSMRAAKDHIRSMRGSVRSMFSMVTIGPTIVTLLAGQGARLHPWYHRR